MIFVFNFTLQELSLNAFFYYYKKGTTMTMIVAPPLLKSRPRLLLQGLRVQQWWHLSQHSRVSLIAIRLPREPRLMGQPLGNAIIAGIPLLATMSQRLSCMSSGLRGNRTSRAALLKSPPSSFVITRKYTPSSNSKNWSKEEVLVA